MISASKIVSASVLSAVGLLLWTGSALACSADTECRGERICVEGRCAAPVRRAAPVSVASASPADAPVLQRSSRPASYASASSPAVGVAAESDAESNDDGLLKLAGGKYAWSASFLLGVGSLTGQTTGFLPDVHVEVGVPVHPWFSAVGLLDLGLPVFDSNADFMAGLGAAIEAGTRYRISLGGEVLAGDDAAAGQVNFGGGAVLHGSVPLTKNWGAHMQLCVLGIHGTSMFTFGLGVGYQG